MSGWQYKRADGEIVGILSDDEIKSCAERGGISLDSPVMHEEKTQGKWVAASRLMPLRKRIESYQQRQAPPAPPGPMATGGYIPPAQPRISTVPLKTLAQGVQQTAISVIRTAISAIDQYTAKKSLHTCLKCEREFAKYEVLGKCPLCGEWAIVACETCGLESGAKRFVENECKCPRCGDKVTV